MWVNPVTCETIGRVGISTKEEIDSAVKAAGDAFKDWRETACGDTVSVSFQVS